MLDLLWPDKTTAAQIRQAVKNEKTYSAVIFGFYTRPPVLITHRRPAQVIYERMRCTGYSWAWLMIFSESRSRVTERTNEISTHTIAFYSYP